MGVGKEISRGILQLGQHSSVAASNTLRWAGPRMAGRGQKQANRSAQPAAKSPGGARLGRQRYFEFTSRRKLPISNAPKDFRHGPVVYVGIATYEWRATLHQCCRTTYKENLSVSFPPASPEQPRCMCSLQLPESWHEAWTTFCELGIGRTFQTSSQQSGAKPLRGGIYRGFDKVWNTDDAEGRQLHSGTANKEFVERSIRRKIVSKS